jgi:hypothetical protein
MKIKSISLTMFDNNEHYKYQTDVNGLISILPVESLPIGDEVATFKKLYTDEGEALNYVRKSIYSKQLSLADLKCNETLDGMDNVINGGLKHYDPTVKGAAAHIKVLWDTNGDIKHKAQKNKSGAIIKLIANLRGTYAADVAALGMDGWVTELDADLAAHDAIEDSRYDEKDGKTHLRMIEVRKEIDTAYHTFTEKINALIIVNGEGPYADFVNKLNLHIDSYTTNLALRNGKGKKGTDTSTSETK